jgi:hypothetical protein
VCSLRDSFSFLRFVVVAVVAAVLVRLLYCTIEVVDLSDTPPPAPDYFSRIDTDGDGNLGKAEIEAFFADQGQPVPDGIWESEDKNSDGQISWEEFSGPKGDAPPSSASSSSAGDDESKEEL